MTFFMMAVGDTCRFPLLLVDGYLGDMLRV